MAQSVVTHQAASSRCTSRSATSSSTSPATLEIRCEASKSSPGRAGASIPGPSSPLGATPPISSAAPAMKASAPRKRGASRVAARTGRDRPARLAPRRASGSTSSATARARGST